MTKKFEVVFLTTVVLTALCGLGMGVLAMFVPAPYSAPVDAFFNSLRLGFGAGLFTIFRLLHHLLRPARSSRRH